MDPSVIREFLVSLGYEVNESGRRKFEQGVNNSTKVVAGLAAGLTALVAAAVASANQMEKLFFASQRTGAAVKGIQALGYAVTDLGGSAEGALNSIESIARFMRNNPGGENYLKSLGVQTRDANGQLRDTSDILVDVGKRLAQMPTYRANAYAQVLGIDEKTLLALKQGVGDFSADYKRMADAVGLNSDKAAKQSHAFMVELRGLWAGADILQKRFTIAFAEKLTPVIEKARRWIEVNGALIARVIDNVVEGLGVLAQVAGTIIGRAIEVFNRLAEAYRRLNPETKNFIVGLAAIAAGIKILSTVFNASPLGRFIALLSGLLLLLDDYETWKSGGKSAIDWSKWEPYIKGAIDAFKQLSDLLGNGKDSIGAWQTAGEIVLAYFAGKWLTGMLGVFGKVKGALPLAGGGAVAGVTAAGVAGAIGGTYLNKKFFDGTALGDYVGWGVATLMARGGSKEAQDALDHSEKRDWLGRKYARGIQNNNPGNLEFHGQRGATSDGRFARWNTPQEGLDALAVQLNRYYQGLTTGKHLDTVKSIIETYAPRSDPSNHTDSYIADVMDQMRITDPNMRLNLSDPQRMFALMRGIVDHENANQNPYSVAMYSDAIQKGSQGGRTLQQSTTINVNGGRDAATTAREVQQRQDGVNQRLARNLSPASS